MKLTILVLLCLTVGIHQVICVFTEKQMKATLKLLKNTCQSKTKTPEEEIAAHHTGDFSGGQCYLLCLINTYKLLTKDNEFDWKGGIVTVEANAPPEMAKFIVKSFENCKDSLKTRDDMCVGAAEIAKCIYDDNPEKYFLP